MPVNPRGTARTKKSNNKGKQPYGEAQRLFIKETRSSVAHGLGGYFKDVNWSRISPCKRGGRAVALNGTGHASVCAESFCVKDIAVWTPHLIMPGFVPSCPRCQSSEHVDVNGKLNFVARPKILHGLNKHRCLDTVCYHCRDCNGDFAGYNEKSLEVDANELIGIFNVHVSSGFAVSEELCSYIINHSNDPTATIHKRLMLMLSDQHIADAMCCYKCVQLKKIKPHDPNAQQSNHRQLTIDHFCSDQSSASPALKKQRSLEKEIKLLGMDIKSLENKCNGDIEFIDVFRMKKSRNHRQLPFKGLGEEKLLRCVHRKITTAKELIEHDGGDPAILPQWKHVCQTCFDNLKLRITNQKNKLEKLEEDLRWAIMQVMVDEEVTGADSVPASTPRPPTFSEFDNTEGYNARVVPKATVDRIIVTDFRSRKQLQLDKMRGIKATALKIDWAYKLAPKIKVYNGRGKPFSPFKSAISIQNEDAAAVFWKCYPCGESFQTIKNDLVQLRKRFEVLKSPIKMTCVDNCCNVRGTLKRTFGDVLVLLDCYHWCARWDPLLDDTTGGKAELFRGLLRKALFVVEPGEHNRAKCFLQRSTKFRKLCRSPTTHEVLKEAKGTIPDGVRLGQRVQAVLDHCFFEDVNNDIPSTLPAVAAVGTSRPKQSERFFKPLTDKMKDLISNQMSHVKNGCLSDPHKSVLKMFCINPTSGKTYTARSTGTNEVDNRYLNRLLNTPSVGTQRADRVTSDHCEQTNEKKRVSRLGEGAALTHRTEKLCVLHSMAVSAGFTDLELPTSTIEIPTELDTLTEHIGMEHELPSHFEEKEDTTADNNDEALHDEEAQAELAAFMSGIEWEDDDVPISMEDKQTENAMDDVEKKVWSTYTRILKTESTFDTFSRLTKDRPWVPFKRPNETRSKEEEEEFNLFVELCSNCDRHAKSSVSYTHLTLPTNREV